MHEIQRARINPKNNFFISFLGTGCAPMNSRPPGDHFVVLGLAGRTQNISCFVEKFRILGIRATTGHDLFHYLVPIHEVRGLCAKNGKSGGMLIFRKTGTDRLTNAWDAPCREGCRPVF